MLSSSSGTCEKFNTTIQVEPHDQPTTREAVLPKCMGKTAHEVGTQTSMMQPKHNRLNYLSCILKSALIFLYMFIFQVQVVKQCNVSGISSINSVFAL